MRLPVETLAVVVEEIQSLQGAANGFGTLISCAIEVAPEREGEPRILLVYSDREWYAHLGVPTEPTHGDPSDDTHTVDQIHHLFESHPDWRGSELTQIADLIGLVRPHPGSHGE